MPRDSKIKREHIMAMADLPEPSAMLLKLIPMLSSEDVRMNDLVPEIERDQALVARILKLVNSSYYHLKSKVDTVRAAVGLLGLSMVRQTVYSAICYSYFPEDERRAWSHAYTTSLLIGKLEKGSPNHQKGCLQLTALLHDVGKIVFRSKYTKRYNAAMKRQEKEGILSDEAERLEFGADHGLVGSWLLESWQMRQDIVVPIAYHHSGKLPDTFAWETALLVIANWTDNKVRGIELPLPSEEIFAAAGISIADIDALRDAHAAQLSAIEEDSEGIFI